MIVVAGYNFTERLGRGTYGEVFKAINHTTRVVVAVKRISKKSLTARAQDNLVDEIGILKNLRHRNIAHLLDFTWDSEYVYMFMEYMAGGDLSTFLKTKRRLPERIIRYFLQQLAFALHYLYERNIVHMDIKPQNILLTPSATPILKLTDFGFAQALKETTKMNEIRGSLLYMAPEIYQFGVYNKSCDLWSVGVILYEFLFGNAPFACSSVEDLKAKLLENSPIEIPTTSKYSSNCIDLVSKMLQRKPETRIRHEQFFVHPFIDLPHAPCPQSINKAIDYLIKTDELKATGNMVDAYLNCTEGLQHMVSALQFEDKLARKRIIRTKLNEYITMAEGMKQSLNGESPSIPTVLSSSSLSIPQRNLCHFKNSDPITSIKMAPIQKSNDVVNQEDPSHTQLPTSVEKSSNSKSLSRVFLLASWFGSRGSANSSKPSNNSPPTTPGTESNQAPLVKNPYEYALIRLDALDELVTEITSSLARVVKGMRKFYSLLNNNEFQSGMDYIQSEFGPWLNIVKSDEDADRQKAFKTELGEALSAAEKLKANLKSKANLEVTLGEEASEVSDDGQSCAIS